MQLIDNKKNFGGSVGRHFDSVPLWRVSAVADEEFGEHGKFKGSRGGGCSGRVGLGVRVPGSETLHKQILALA